MFVKNINGTSDNPRCPCGTWLKHWERYAGREAGLCAVKECLNDAEVGGHVQKDSGDQSWCVIPLCYRHNNKFGGKLNISDTVKLVPVTSRSKCKN
jgi:hypothetical protein